MGVGQQKIVGTLTIAAEQDSSLMALSWLFCAGGASVNSAEITGGKALLWYYYRITRLSQLILPRTIYPQREGKKERRRNKTTELNHSCVNNIHGNPYTVYIILAQYEGSRLDSWELVLAMENLTKKKDCVFFATLLSPV